MIDLPKFPPHCCIEERHYCERDAWKEEFVAWLETEREKSCEPQELAVVYIKDLLEAFE